MKLGTFVCDKNYNCLAIVIFDHSITGLKGLSKIKLLSNGRISSHKDSELKELTPEEFCKLWCKKEMGCYGGKSGIERRN